VGRTGRVAGAERRDQRAACQPIASGTTLFRSIGAAVGVSLFGAIFTASLAANLASGLPSGASLPAATDPAAIQALPTPLRTIYLEAFTAALHPVFLSAAAVSSLGFALSWFLKEVPLHGPVRGETLPAREEQCHLRSGGVKPQRHSAHGGPAGDETLTCRHRTPGNRRRFDAIVTWGARRCGAALAGSDQSVSGAAGTSAIRARANRSSMALASAWSSGAQRSRSRASRVRRAVTIRWNVSRPR